VQATPSRDGLQRGEAPGHRRAEGRPGARPAEMLRANGITVTTRNGRPLKIEGNAEHPWSRGGTDVFAQAWR
jgi:5-enolpyruvylshikimate-3-phosphate synthase